MKARSFLVAAVLALVSVQVLAGNSNPVSASAQSGGDGLFVAATLAPLNSFEFKAAPSYTRLAVVRRNALVALRNGKITADQAQAVQDRANAVRVLLDRALATCAQSNKTGKCTKDAASAERLLQAANAQLVAIK
jgi:hypothetical protein